MTVPRWLVHVAMVAAMVLGVVLGANLYRVIVGG